MFAIYSYGYTVSSSAIMTTLIISLTMYSLLDLHARPLHLDMTIIVSVMFSWDQSVVSSGRGGLSIFRANAVNCNENYTND